MRIKYLFYILSPFIIFLLVTAFPLNNVYMKYILAIVFLIYWFIIGAQFPEENDSYFESLLLGNMVIFVSAICFTVYSFIGSNNFIFEIINILSKVSSKIVSQLVLLVYDNEQNTKAIEYISSLLILISFSAGYIITYKNARRSIYTFDKKMFIRRD